MGASATFFSDLPATLKSTSLPWSLKNGESGGLLLPFTTTTPTSFPSGEILRPSGV